MSVGLSIGSAEPATAQCRAVLAGRFPGIEVGSPADWFALLSLYPHDREGRRALDVLGLPPAEAFRYALVNAIIEAVPRLMQTPLDPAVRRLTLDMLGRIAAPPPDWEPHFSDPWRRAELAQFVTLRRFAAGQHDWEVAGLPRSWVFKFHPVDLPRVALALGRMGGFTPFAALHLDAYRSNRLMMLESGMRTSMARIARSLERQDWMRGLMARSWFYDPQVAELTPHLGWLRRFFLDNGAVVVPMEHAPEDAGFLVGSAARRRLFAEGRFRPRTTLVLWPREAMLAWVRAQAPEDEP
ncbi:MAG: hypothetical protein ACM33T_01845 [Solirubrobacterales bacterium]